MPIIKSPAQQTKSSSGHGGDLRPSTALVAFYKKPKVKLIYIIKLLIDRFRLTSASSGPPWPYALAWKQRAEELPDPRGPASGTHRSPLPPQAWGTSSFGACWHHSQAYSTCGCLKKPLAGCNLCSHPCWREHWSSTGLAVRALQLFPGCKHWRSTGTNLGAVFSISAVLP